MDPKSLLQGTPYLACECSNVQHLLGSRHLHLKLQKLTFQSSNHAGGKKILIIGACGNNLDIIRYQGGVSCCIVLNSRMEQCYLKIYIVFNNRFLRERGMASIPKMKCQVFLCFFQKNSAMATLGLKEMGKFL